jgi:hypothetical protein
VKPIPSFVVIATLALGLTACGSDTPPKPKTGEAAGTTSVATQSSVPPAQADRDSPPAQTPATHAGTPQVDPPTPPAAQTARETSETQKPMDSMTKAEEQNQMPMAGQVNNYSTTATDKPNKDTPPAEGIGAAPQK